jgi:hypothetical protein
MQQPIGRRKSKMPMEIITQTHQKRAEEQEQQKGVV